jgi:cysteine desulfurase
MLPSVEESLRADAPITDHRLIFCDNNATTQPTLEVVDAVVKALRADWANPSSVHGLGQAAARSVAAARTQVAGLLGVRPERVVFTSGATEANEAVLRHHAGGGATLLTSAAEHPAVNGYYLRYFPERLRFIPLHGDGRWRLDSLEAALAAADGPTLIALAWANGETGVLQDISAIEALATRYGASWLVDVSQAVGRVVTSVPNTAYLTLSAHKLHGPKGVGALVQPEGYPPVTVAVGGGQEAGSRGGTANVPGIVGFGVACALRARDLPGAISRLAGFRDRLEAAVRATVPEVQVNGFAAPRVPNTTNLTFSGVDGMALVARLEARGILCSQVSACASAQPEPSRTLLAMHRSREEAFASLRIAFSVENTEVEVEFVAQALAEEVHFLREVMGGLV